MVKKSKQRDAILRVLRSTNTHPTVQWIYDQVRHEIPNISMGTVYRNLKLLKQEGQIMELDIADTSSRFDGTAQNHYHFRCEQCRRVFDVDEPVCESLDKRVAEKTGFKISYHLLEFRGLCKDCQCKTALNEKK
ncbi:transcriptional repressor [Chloroflexota bacterium]